MPFSVPSTLEKHTRKCTKNVNNIQANVNQNSNSSSGNLTANSINNSSTVNATSNDAHLLNNTNNLLGLAGLTGSNLLNNSFLSMVNSQRNSPNANSLLNSLTSAGFLSATD